MHNMPSLAHFKLVFFLVLLLISFLFVFAPIQAEFIILFYCFIPAGLSKHADFISTKIMF